MKKIKILLLLLLIPVFLCSCEKKEYNLIEITGDELVKNMLEEDKNFVFAIVDKSEEDAEQFLKDLNNVSKSANINIYYVDYLHMSQDAAFKLFTSYSTDFSTNGYHVIQNKDLVVSSAYTDFKTLYTTLKTKAFKNELVRVDKKTKLNYIKEAQKLYKENQIGEAHNLLTQAWDLEEAKKEHNDNKYYHLINGWERTVYTNDIPEKTKYTSFIFNSGESYYVEQKITKETEEFDGPTDEDKFETVYYRLESDILLTSNREKGYYEETYQIMDVTDEFLTLKNLKTDKKETYVRRGNL